MPNQKPAIKWGQRKDHVFLTIAVQDIHHPEIQIDQNRLCFKGERTNGTSYETSLELFDEINPKLSNYRQISQNHWEFVLKKHDVQKPFWSRLIKSTEKCEWIKSDWDHFVEDDANDEALDGNLHKDWHRIDDLLNKVNGKYLINN